MFTQYTIYLFGLSSKAATQKCVRCVWMKQKKNEMITHTNEMYGILRRKTEKNMCFELPLLHLKEQREKS